MKYVLLGSLISVQLYTILYLNLNYIFGYDISRLYEPIMIAILLITLIYQLYLIIYHRKVNIIFILFLLNFLLLGIYIVIGNNTNIQSNYLILFQSFLWVIPCVILGINIQNIELEDVNKFFTFIFIWVSITLLVCIELPYILSNTKIVDSSLILNHQTISYISSLFYGIGLFLLKYKKNAMIIVICLFEITNAHVTLLSGGRGGSILLLVYNFYFMLEIYRHVSIKAKYFIFMLFTLFTAFVYKYLKDNELVTRSFSYIDDSGLNLNKTSGRNELYSHAFELIKNKIWFGHGFFNYYYDLNGTPHNIILEILLIGGICLLLIVGIVCSILFLKFNRIYEQDTIDRFVKYLSLYPLVMLMFSGNFLLVGCLWFCIIYVIRRTMRYKIEK